MKRSTSRVLNDQSFLLGLSYSDITNVGILLLLQVIVFKSMGITSMLIPLILTLSVLGALVPLRMNFRRKIIRDSISSLIHTEVIRVSRSSRIRK